MTIRDKMSITYRVKINENWIDGTLSVSKSKFYFNRNISSKTTEETAKQYIHGQYKANSIQDIEIISIENENLQIN